MPTKRSPHALSLVMSRGRRVAKGHVPFARLTVDIHIMRENLNVAYALLSEDGAYERFEATCEDAQAQATDGALLRKGDKSRSKLHAGCFDLGKSFIQSHLQGLERSKSLIATVNYIAKQHRFYITLHAFIKLAKNGSGALWQLSQLLPHRLLDWSLGKQVESASISSHIGICLGTRTQPRDAGL